MKIPILTYHSIDGSGSIISTSPDIFRRQMRQLRESSCEVLPLQAIVAALRENRELPANAVAITFDDGFHSVYSQAFPVLQEYGFPATVFLVTAYCGQPSPWNLRTPKIGPAPLATWDQVAKMSRGGIDIGSHTVLHPDLTRIRPTRAEHEIRMSRRIIEGRLGRAVTAFAYPFGHSNAEVRAMVEREYECACSTRLGMVDSGSAPYRLQRIEMYYFAPEARFESLLRGQADSYLAVRRTLRLVRGWA
jgi:peptidoglycan/xylan/chitin deacetylase (PgdA/CDA1 family)